MNDEPNAPGLTLDEVAEIQKHLADIPAHMIPSEMQKIEKMFERKKLDEMKNKNTILKSKLD
eukprot:CAMPEP_0176402266 /NCGR_PEP_ID=MMETSP0126-20121128/49127_1 /TAXON_ID=141414 ORGANISM="Strombidinopsis acuminatum, Strain SPMC142" /NCGR_SAMPLE_ID=MMETSP0126 /ASSEMBLY_ACC=CAM_ASM_000229 /LENGTH=61 /DNA_ID=CAMNT_0017779753 /DNA_START=493 /DNA_END=678 /DNA_ORIENTATION=-